MKQIPGYEIVEGWCDNCDFYFKDCRAHCDVNKIYKKKEELNTIETIEDVQEVNIHINGQKVEEKTMTHDEMIEVIQAHKEGRKIYVAVPGTIRTQELYNPSLNGIVNLMSTGTKLIVKPEPKVIPWTIKDAEIFLEKTLIEKASLEAYRITSCNLSGLFMKKIKADEYESTFFLYETVLADFIFNGNHCGKVVEE